MGPAIPLIAFFIFWALGFLAAQIVYAVLKRIPLFQKRLFRRLFFWVPIVLPLALLAGLGVWMSGVIPMRPERAFASIYDVQPPDNTEFGKAKRMSSTDYAEIYLSYRISPDVDRLLASLNEDKLGDLNIDDAPRWWRGEDCGRVSAAEHGANKYWERRVTIKCDDGWAYAYAYWID